MKKRPFVIKALAYLYFVSPLFIILELMLVYKINPTRLSLTFFYINWHVVLMMVLTPIVGFGIWSVRKWGYYLLLGHSIFMILNNIVLAVARITPVPIWAVIIFNLLLLGIIVTFVRKEVYAPYFNPRIRWWEQAARYYYDKMRVIVKKLGTDTAVFEAKSFDVSETGVFVVTDKDVSIGDKFSMELVLADKSMLYSDGEVVWVNKPKKADTNPTGFGCKFIMPNSLFKKRIRFHMMDIGAKIKERALN
jgi:Tfp pilus assembly protein PilZ